MQKSTTRKKRPIGRPDTYRKEYCEMLIAHMAEGYSFESFAANIRSYHEIMYDWCERHPDFLQAKKIGHDLSRKYYEQIGKGLTLGKIPGGSVASWIFIMKNRFSWLADLPQSAELKTQRFVLKYNLDKDIK